MVGGLPPPKKRRVIILGQAVIIRMLDHSAWSHFEARTEIRKLKVMVFFAAPSEAA